jgi:insertion element IS1 protein InsB
MNCLIQSLHENAAFCRFKKNKLWLIKAIDRSTGRTVAWVLGNRDTATFQRLYDKVRHLTGCTFYTDDWKAFAQILPPERHIAGKAHTIGIVNMTTATHGITLTLRIWHAVTATNQFLLIQRAALSIFR